jgi:hypothetical protein
MVNITEKMKEQAQRVFEEMNKLTDLTREANPGTDGHVGSQSWYAEFLDEYRGEITLFGLHSEDESGFESADITRDGNVVQKFIKHED